MIVGLVSLFAWANASAEPPVTCDTQITAKLTIDQGHLWRPPFGLDRVGSPLIAHVAIISEQIPRARYFLIAYRGATALKREPLQLSVNPSDYGGFSKFLSAKTAGQRFAHVPLPQETTEAVLERRCSGAMEVLDRQAISRPALEADATARPLRPTNPIDLGAILPSQNGLLMRRGESAIVELAALSNAKDLRSVRLTVWFEGGSKFVKPLVLPKGKRITESITLPLSSSAQSTALRIRMLDDGERTLFSKDIRVMVGAEKSWPAFGAVETKLRYDAPIPTFDPRSGAALGSTSYEAAWDKRFNDLVVFLPNGARFVFWRGANYIPFWAGQHNTGTLYQWVEDCNHMISHPDGSRDCPEPLFDTELRYSRVRLVESTSARIHVRWDYQPTDVRYEYQSGRATEHFYFYPDGFGTRVVTFAAPPSAGPPQLSEFILITPASAYPFEVLPKHPLKVISLQSGRAEQFAFPYPQTLQPDPDSSATRIAQLPLPDRGPALFRVFSHKDDPASAIYLHFNSRTDTPALAPHVFPPMYDRGELVAPIYWGNHWPLTRGKWTGWSINDQLSAGPAHSSLAVWIPVDMETRQPRFEVPPLQQGQWEMPDCNTPDRLCTVSRLAWLIGQTELPDADVVAFGRSYLHPPALSVTGGRLANPTYHPERRALNVVAESQSIAIQLKPPGHTVNPVFEIEGAPKIMRLVKIDGKPLAMTDYAWDGETLWIRAKIGPQGAKIHLDF